MEEERLMILKMLEEGKISAEEAAELLRALEATAGAEPAAPQAAGARRAAGDWIDQMAARAEALALRGGRAAEALAERIPSVMEHVERLFESLGLALGEPFRFESVVEGAFADGVQHARVALHSVNGPIHVRGWDRDHYRIELVKSVRARDEAQARQLAERMVRVTQGAEFVAVELGERVPGGMRINAWLPARLDVDLEGRTCNGRIEVEDLSARRLRLDTSNGRIQVSGGRCRSAQLTTSNGRVVLAVPAQEVEVRTSNGRIVVAPEDGVGPGRYDLQTSNGPILVRFQRGLPVRVDLATSLGRVDVEVEGLTFDTNERGLRSRVVGASPGFQAGTGADIRARTTNGSIRIGPGIETD